MRLPCILAADIGLKVGWHDNNLKETLLGQNTLMSNDKEKSSQISGLLITGLLSSRTELITQISSNIFRITNILR